MTAKRQLGLQTVSILNYSDGYKSQKNVKDLKENINPNLVILAIKNPYIGLDDSAKFGFTN